MFSAVQTLEQITAVNLDMFHSVCKINAVYVFAVRFLNFGGKPRFFDIIPVGITEKRTVIIAVRKPVFLLPAVIPGGAANKLVKL